MTDTTHEHTNSEDQVEDQAPESDEARRSVTDDLKQSARKIWLAGLGALSIAEREGTKAFNALVEHGENFEERSRPHVEDLKARAKKARDEASEKLRAVEQKVAARIQQGTGVAGQRQVDELKQRIADLEAALERLMRSESEGPADDETPAD